MIFFCGDRIGSVLDQTKRLLDDLAGWLRSRPEVARAYLRFHEAHVRLLLLQHGAEPDEKLAELAVHLDLDLAAAEDYYFQDIDVVVFPAVSTAAVKLALGAGTTLEYRGQWRPMEDEAEAKPCEKTTAR